MAAKLQKPILYLAWRLVERLEARRGKLPLDGTGHRDMILRIAAGLQTNQISARGALPVEPDLESLALASRLVREEVRFTSGRELEPKGILPEALDCRLGVPEVVRISKQSTGVPRSYPAGCRELINYLDGRPGLVQELLEGATVVREEPTEIAPMVAVRHSTSMDKLELLEEILQVLRPAQLVTEAADRSGRFPEDCLAIIRVDIGPTLRLDADGLYPDPTLVLALASALFEAGIGRVLLGSDGGFHRFGLTETEPARILAHLGYVDPGLTPVARLDPAAPPPARVLCNGAEREVPVIDLGSDAGRKTWTEADLRVLVTSPRVHGADRLALTLHGLVDYRKNPALPKAARRSAIRSAQMVPVHLAMLEATTGSDGTGGEVSCPISRVLATLIAGTDPLTVDAVAAQLFGVDPFDCPMIERGTRKLGIRSFHLDGKVKRLPGWRNRVLAPALTTQRAPLRQSLASVPARPPDAPFPAVFGPLGPRLLSSLTLRPFWAGSLRPACLLARGTRRKLTALAREREGRTRLSASDEVFLDLISELPRRDISALLDFLRRERETVEAGQGDPRRLGHRLRVGDATLELRSYTARPVIAATEILRGVTFGRWDLQSVIEDLRGWEEIHSLPKSGKLLVNRLNPPRKKADEQA